MSIKINNQDILLICFYGPESTGKSTMAKKIAAHFKTEWVPEVAREIVESNDFTLEDIKKIGFAQNQRIKEKLPVANRILICDTDIITTRIYSDHYLGSAPQELDALEKEFTFDRYFLFDIDVPWVADGMRDLSGQREKMMNKFRRALESRNIAYTLVTGNYEEREKSLVREIETMIN
jgi:HTH-type transcriptional repressor of NAD biosynthesis genes